MMIEALLVLGALLGPAAPDDAAPAAAPKKQEEKPPEAPPPAPAPAPILEEQGLPWIDFDWVDFQPRVGLALFSDDYRMDPAPYFSLLAHVPVPLLSPGSDPGGEYFGLFAEAAFIPRVERDLDPEPDDPSGMVLLASLGFDFTLLRNQSLYLVVQGGAQYGWYGGISDMDDGIASMAGLAGGIFLGKGCTLTLGSEVVFAHAGDRIYLNSLGLLIEF